MTQPIVLSRWVLSTGRVMPELPDRVASCALELIERALGSKALPFDERREAIERVASDMLRELRIKESGR